LDAAHPVNYAGRKVQSFAENTLFERPAQPIELARIFVFSHLGEASYVSGETYGATGGTTPL
jgi:NAD(P)-dependent dehydrogenase (short-subunit alcohol dehydrogenase family)